MTRNLLKVMVIAAALLTSKISAAQTQASVIQIKPGEHWYGGVVNEAHTMPLKDGYKFNLFANTGTNQAAPLLLSTTVGSTGVVGDSGIGVEVGIGGGVSVGTGVSVGIESAFLG